MDAQITKPVQLVYSNETPWYGVRLIAGILGDVATIVPAKKVLSARGDPVFMFSFLSSREYPSIFQVFDRAGLPYTSRSRTAAHPLVIAGGGAMMNPEPVADFIDIACIGDGELWAAVIRQLIIEGRDKKYMLDALSELPGAYIPSNREIEYDSSGIFVKSVSGETEDILPAVTAELPETADTGPLRDIELARGCQSNRWRFVGVDYSDTAA